MSKVGITTFVKVWCNLLSPNSFFMRLWRYFPSYFGPVRALNRFTNVPKIPLYVIFETPKKMVSTYELLRKLEN